MRRLKLNEDTFLVSQLLDDGPNSIPTQFTVDILTSYAALQSWKASQRRCPRWLQHRAESLSRVKRPGMLLNILQCMGHHNQESSGLISTMPQAIEILFSEVRAILSHKNIKLWDLLTKTPDSLFIMNTCQIIQSIHAEQLTCGR